MDLECTHLVMATAMKDSGKIVKSMDKEKTNLKMEIHMLENIKMENIMVLGNTFGLIWAVIQVYFITV